jgi:hypothetical protein
MKITISKEIKAEESAKEISRLTAPLYLEKKTFKMEVTLTVGTIVGGIDY